MNIASAIAIYANVCKELREPLMFPGNLRFYTGFDSHSHSKLIAGTTSGIIASPFSALLILPLSFLQNSKSGQPLTQTSLMNASIASTAILQHGNICGPALPNTLASAFHLTNSHAAPLFLPKPRCRKTLH